MLFDLRGSGRRRTVRIVYAFLAVLMGAGLVGFGIGGAGVGGCADALNNRSQSASDTFGKKVRALERKVKANPSDAASWAELARVRFQQTSIGENYDQSTSSFTAKGKAKLREVESAWKKYLSLNPKKPNSDVARLMVQALGPSGLGKLDEAVGAMEIVAESQPKQYALWAQLAQLAYAAGQSRKGDLSSEKAVKLAPKDQRKNLKTQLDQYKLQALQQSVGGATTPAGPTG